MSKLSIANLLHYLSEVKTLVHDNDTTAASAKLDEIIFQLTGDKCVCARCGRSINEVDYQMAGEYCEPCSDKL